MGPTTQEGPPSPVFEKEVSLLNGEKVKLPSVHIDKKILYHGSHAQGLRRIDKAGDTTVGEGVYLTSDRKSAEGYAKRRSKNFGTETPTVYSLEVRDLDLADLRTKEATVQFSKLLGQRLSEELASGRGDYWYRNTIKTILELIRSGKELPLKDITFNFTDLTTDILSEAGYDGLITIEGGEGRDVGNHDTYLIFDPEKIKNLSSESMALERAA